MEDKDPVMDLGPPLDPYVEFNARELDEDEYFAYQPPTADDDELELARRRIIYSDSPGGTFVISGPLPGGGGGGRYFAGVEAAEAWVLWKYKRHYGRIREAEPGGRWAFRVKPPISTGGETD